MNSTLPRTDALASPPGSRGELLRVALPLVISSGSLSLMYVVDRIFLTWYSTDALAASLPAGMLHWTLISLFLGTAAYVNTFVAQYAGAGRHDRVASAVWQGLYLSLFASVLMLACLPLAGPFFTWLTDDPHVRQLEIDYFQIICLGTAPFLLQASLSCFYSGRGQTRVIMWVNLASSLFNIVFDYLLIFGPGPFPELGIRGAAIATAGASALALILYVAILAFGAEGKRYALLQGWRFDRQLFARLVRFGLPNGLNMFVDIVCFTLFIYVVGMMGKGQLAATNLAFNLNALAFVPMLGVGTAISTLIGQRIGEGRPELAVRTSWTAFQLSGVYMAVFAGIYVLLPEVILLPYKLFSKPQEFDALHEQVIVLLRFVAVYSLFDAMAIVFSAAIRGAGDTRFALLFTAAAGLGLMVLPTAAAYWWLDDPLIAAWSSCTVFVVVLGVGFLLRFHGGKWKSMRVIEPHLDDMPNVPAVALAGVRLDITDESYDRDRRLVPARAHAKPLGEPQISSAP